MVLTIGAETTVVCGAGVAERTCGSSIGTVVETEEVEVITIGGVTVDEGSKEEENEGENEEELGFWTGSAPALPLPLSTSWFQQRLA